MLSLRFSVKQAPGVLVWRVQSNGNSFRGSNFVILLFAALLNGDQLLKERI